MWQLVDSWCPKGIRSAWGRSVKCLGLIAGVSVRRLTPSPYCLFCHSSQFSTVRERLEKERKRLLRRLEKMIVVSLHLPFLWQLNPVLVLAKWLLGTWGLCALVWKTTTANTSGWLLRGEFVKCTWKNTTGLNGLSFSLMLDGGLYFRISAYMQHLKWTSGSVDTTKATLAFVTMSHKL